MNANNLNISSEFKTAVLFLVFNRPDTTSKVFEKIREIKPTRLYVAADGPRVGYGDQLKINEVREIATKIDWPCKVKTLFRDKNLGCKKAVSTAITWFFKFEEQGIILEDDCLPNLDFFQFCEVSLERYFNDKRISAITGNNFQNGIWRGNGSYYFSKFNHCWGWASWRRSWSQYQGDIEFWPNWRESMDWSNYISDKVEREYWKKIFDRVYDGKIDSWAYPWTASVWYNKGITVTPNVNLVSNIGFGNNATHTISEKNKLSEIKLNKLGTLRHPRIIDIDIEADRWTFDNHFGGKNFRFPKSLFLFPYRLLGFVYKKLKLFFLIR